MILFHFTDLHRTVPEAWGLSTDSCIRNFNSGFPVPWRYYSRHHCSSSLASCPVDRFLFLLDPHNPDIPILYTLLFLFTSSSFTCYCTFIPIPPVLIISFCCALVFVLKIFVGFPNERIYLILCIRIFSSTKPTLPETNLHATPVLQEVDQVLSIISRCRREGFLCVVMGNENHIFELWTIIPLLEVRPSISMYLIYKWSLGYTFTVIHLEPWLKRNADCWDYHQYCPAPSWPKSARRS